MTSVRSIHFIGISGIGMSALARVLAERGLTVRGSTDRRTALTDRLTSEGIAVDVGHAAANLGGADLVVVSSAIAPDNPERLEARRRGLEVVRRGTLLARLMAERKGVAIAGTHGKTTSSAMIAHVLTRSNLEPAWTVGGELVDYGVNGRDGAGPWFVAESDESDRSFLELRPFAGLITNIENDHVADDAEFDGLVGDFDRFAAQIAPEGFLCIATDDPRAAVLAGRARAARTVTFGTDRQIYAMSEVESKDFSVSFSVTRDGAPLGRIRMPLVGEMNARNALGAVAVACELGVPFEQAAGALAAFHGVRRRFEVLARTARMTVVDDYAHHPTAIAATIAAARQNAHGPLIAAFQPHRYSRTKYLSEAFAQALRGADAVFLTPVYAASEAPIEGVDAQTIGAPLARSGTPVAYVSSVADLPARLLEASPQGATVLVMGAGSITSAAAELAQAVSAPTAAGSRA